MVAISKPHQSKSSLRWFSICGLTLYERPPSGICFAVLDVVDFPYPTTLLTNELPVSRK